MKKYLLSLLASLLTFENTLQSIEFLKPSDQKNEIVKSTKEIHLQEYPGAWNPSIVKFQEGYLLTFRWAPRRVEEPWVSYIGLILLNDSLDPITKPELLDTRVGNTATPSQSEDARVVYFGDKLYIVYNDNVDLVFPSNWERRDMYIAELIYENGNFSLSEPLCLKYKAKYRDRPWQKNWTPFEWNGQLMLSYSINPHEILVPDLTTGHCIPYDVASNHIPQESWLFKAWEYNSLRGGSPALLIDGEYLAFFHSGVIKNTPYSEHRNIWHYFAGAYTFSNEPPFAIKKVSPNFIDTPGFYTYSSYTKRVIYPGGFVVDGPNIYLAYGKDDCEVWIATIDLANLKESLVEIKATYP